jgi:hypothetical protein
MRFVEVKLGFRERVIEKNIERVEFNIEIRGIKLVLRNKFFAKMKTQCLHEIYSLFAEIDKIFP